MSDLFGIDIAGLIDQNISPGVLPLTLTKFTAGSRVPGALTGGTHPTSTSYAGKGFTSDYDDHQIDGNLIVAGDRMVIIIGKSVASLAVPTPGSQVTIEGTTYNIIRVNRDPAAATYTCQVRGAPSA